MRYSCPNNKPKSAQTSIFLNTTLWAVQGRRTCENKTKKIHVVAVSKTQTMNHLVILQIKGLSLLKKKKNTKRNKSEMKGEPIEKRLKDILTNCNLCTSDSEPKNK